jgi:hypothetical protein
MRRSPAVAALTLAMLALAACSGPAFAPPRSAPAASEPVPTSSATPEPHAIVITLDELRLVDADDAALASVSLRDGDVIGFLEEALGASPTVDTDETYGIDFYEWESVHLSPLEGERGGWVTFIAAEQIGLTLRTKEGLTVGATRDEATAAGAETGYHDEESGLDILQLDTREEPGTESLERPGQTGVVYVALLVEDGVVSRIQAPGNDFSDL